MANVPRVWPAPYEWDAYRQEVKSLYIDQKWRLLTIMDHFAVKYHFYAMSVAGSPVPPRARLI